MYGRQQIIL